MSKKERFFALTFALIALLMSASLHAQDIGKYYGTYEKRFTDVNTHCWCWIQPDGTVFFDPGTIDRYDLNYRYPETYVLPETAVDSEGNEYNISGTARNTFLYSNIYADVKKLVFPECYKAVDALNDGGVHFNSLEEIDAPGLIYMGRHFLSHSSKLKKVNLPHVKEMSDMAFYGCSSLDTINLPELETCYGTLAFNSCSSLVCLNVPKLKNLGGFLFYGCTSLKELHFPSVVTMHQDAFTPPPPNLEYLRMDSLKKFNVDLSYSSGNHLKTVILPEVDSITVGYLFRGSTSLTHIELPKLRYAADSLFYACTSLEHVELPNLVSAKTLFYFCQKLRYASMPKLTDDCGQNNNILKVCTNLDTLIVSSVPKIYLPEQTKITMLDIGSVTADNLYDAQNYTGEFYNFANIKHIICQDAKVLDRICKVSQGLANMPDAYWPAYSSATDYAAFDSVEFVNQTEALGDSIFYRTPNIKHIVLHGNSTLENMKAFQMLPNLESIDVADDATGDYSSYDGVLYNRAGNTLLYYPLANETSLNAGGNTRTWQYPDRKITGVGPYALYKYAGKETRDHRELHISKGETCVLGDHALDGSSIDHVTFDLDAPLTTVGNYAMANMTQTAFRYLKMPKALQTIGRAAFAGDTQLQALELYDTQLTTVGDSAFAGETAITSIALPNSVTSIGTQAFYGNTAMEYFTVPRSCTTIGGGAFYNTSLKQFNVQATNETLVNSLGSVFNTLPAKVFAPGTVIGSLPSHFTLAWQQSTAELQPGKYYTISRSYPIDLSSSADIASFYRVITYNIDKPTNTGVLYIERLGESELAAVPANSPVVALIKGSSPAALTYTMAETEPVAWKANLLEGTPGAVRIDTHVSSDATDYYNYLLSHPSTDNTSGVFNIVTSHEWYEESTRKGELTYLHIPYYDTAGASPARRFVFSSGNATGIESATVDSGNANGTWYNLQGQRVNNPSHGVFIRNGRKVILK